jgi:hypothetical protein
MKKALPLLLFMQVFLVSAQSNVDVVKFEHTGGRAAYIKPRILNSGGTVGDVLPQFNVPKFRDEIDVVSVDVKATCKGKLLSGNAPGGNFSEEQRSLLSSADPGSEIFVTVDYKYKDLSKARLSCYPAARKIEYALTAGPQVEAEFPGGKTELNSYFRKAVVDLVEKENQESASKANVHFTINEQGKIENPKIFKTSLNPEIDRLIINAIQNMPDWKPAENLMGEKIKQSFIVNVICTPQGC